MPKIKITIEEHISKSFYIEAADTEEAMEIAKEKYKSGEFVVDPCTPTARLMMAEDAENDEMTEWSEF